MRYETIKLVYSCSLLIYNSEDKGLISIRLMVLIKLIYCQISLLRGRKAYQSQLSEVHPE